MNTANLQLEGVYMAVSALMTALRDKQVLSEVEIDAALAEAEATAGRRKPSELSQSNLEALVFPLRYLRLANKIAAEGGDTSFHEIAAKVGRMR